MRTTAAGAASRWCYVLLLVAAAAGATQGAADAHGSGGGDGGAAHVTSTATATAAGEGLGTSHGLTLRHLMAKKQRPPKPPRKAKPPPPPPKAKGKKKPPPPSLLPPPPPPAPSSTPPEWGEYRLRTEGSDLIRNTNGIDIWAYDIVSGQAVINCRRIMEGMLEAAPSSAVMDGLRKYGAQVPIIGRTQNLTDLPPYAWLKGGSTGDGRPWDALRGIGSNGPSFPYTSAAEENLLFLEEDPFTPFEVIMVHDFAHTVLNVGLNDLGISAVVQQYLQAALVRNAEALAQSPEMIFAFRNKNEYWAVMSEAWFESAKRDDINLGINTRAGLLASDPLLASVFNNVAYGNGTWRYYSDPNLPHEPQSISGASATRASSAKLRPLPPRRHSPIEQLQELVAQRKQAQPNRGI